MELVQHQGYAAIDDLGDRCQITHTMTLEKVSCPGGGWSLEFDEDGFGVAVPPPDSPHDAVVLETTLRFGLYKSKDGAFYVVGASSFTGQVASLSALMQKWEPRQVDLIVGAAKTKRSFEAAAMKWPRTPAARFFWSAKSVYEQCGFDQFSGQEWRWIDASWRRWQSSLAKEHGLGEHVIPTALMKDFSHRLGGRSVWWNFLRLPLLGEADSFHALFRWRIRLTR